MSRALRRVAAVVAAVAVFATAHATRASEVVTIALSTAPRAAGQTGTGALAPQGEATAITLIVSVPDWLSRPVRLYTFVHRGTCARHDRAPELSLNEVVAPDASDARLPRGPFTLKKRVPWPMATLRESERAIVVRSSPADGDVELYCGNLGLDRRAGR
jgi:hypothetical protein